MKIATFNINNVKKRLSRLLSWLKASRPDVVCLQELKSRDADFPARVIEKAGYHSIWRGQKTWNGVAILSRKDGPTQSARCIRTNQCRGREGASDHAPAWVTLSDGKPRVGSKSISVPRRGPRLIRCAAFRLPA